MNGRTRLVVVLVAGGVLGVGVVAVAGPAIAGAGPFGHRVAAVSWSGPGGGGPGAGMGAGPGAGVGMRAGAGMDAGDCLSLPGTAASGTLSDPQRGALVGMARDEKLAGDLYRVFADRYPAVVVFGRVAAAEGQHLDAVRALLGRYGVTDPTAGRPAGVFSDATVQATYDRLLAQGRASQSAAIAVGQQVENLDIADLRTAQSGLTAPDVTQVYQRLLAASQRHLEVFTAWATR